MASVFWEAGRSETAPASSLGLGMRSEPVPTADSRAEPGPLCSLGSPSGPSPGPGPVRVPVPGPGPGPRSMRRWSSQSGETVVPVTPALRPETLDVERAMATLSPTARAVVWLFEVEGYSHEEIARQFGRSVSFSKSQLARAHSKLRAWFEPSVDQETCTTP